MVKRKSKSRLVSAEIVSDDTKSSEKTLQNGDCETTDMHVNEKEVNSEKNMDVDAVVPQPEAVEEADPEGEAAADLSFCDASFSAVDSVATSGHTRVSRCTEGVEMFLEAIREHVDRGNDFDFEESLGILTMEEMIALWISLNQYTTTSVMSLVGGVPDESGQAMEVVVGAVMVAKLCTPLPLVQGDSCPPAFLQTAVLLHSVLPSLQDQKLTNNICLFLESWYILELSDRDSLTTNTLVSLLTRSLSSQGSKADVKRVWNLHQTVLGFRLNETEQLRSQLVSTIGSTLYLNCPEGVRWLVFLFSLSPDLVTRLHREVRTSLPLMSSSKTSCAAVGDVYHKAWISSGGQFRTRIELDCIQDLMYRGVLATRGKGGIAVTVLRVLAILHKQKRSPATQSMLTKLYEPILWRHLKVANSMVRLNACELFLSCYPVEDQEQSREERDNCLEMQHTAMMNLLRDENPFVRCSAISGVCNILASYWLLIPSDTINQVVAMLVKESVWDTSNARVRLVTLTGIKALLACPHSHVYLKAVLPRLSDCLHDTNEGVRGAMLDLLLAVKGVRSIKFWTICPLEHLLARLEVDKPFICRRIVKLLFNSYFPPDQGDEVRLERCIHLVQSNRAASRRFYQYCGEMLEVSGAVQLMVAVLTSVKIWVKGKLVGREVETEGDDKENNGKKKRKLYNSSMMSDDTDNMSVSASDISNQSSTVLENTTMNSAANADAEDGVEVDNEDHPYNDHDVVGGILDIVCVLWMVRNSELSKAENDQYRAVLEKKAGRWLTLFFKHFRSTPVCGTVVYLASFLPERLVAPVASYCLARVKGEEGWKTHVDCLCNWRKGDSLLELVTVGIKGGLGKGLVAKGVRFEETQSKDVQLRLAVKLLKYMLDHHANRTILMAKNRPMLDECLELCLSVQEVIEHKIGFSDEKEDTSLNKELALVVDMAGQLTVLLQTDTALARLEELLAWSERELVPVVVGPSETNTSHISRTRSQVSLCETVLSSLCSLVTSCLSLGLSDPEFTLKVLDWAVQLLHAGGAEQVGGVVGVLAEAATVAGMKKGTGWQVLYQEKVLVCFAKLLSWLTNLGDKLEDVEGGVAKLKKGVGAIVKVYSKNMEKDKHSWEDLVEVMVAAVVALLRKKVDTLGEVVIPGTIGELGVISGVLVEVIVKQQGGGDMVGDNLVAMIEEVESEESLSGMMGATLLIASVVKCVNRGDVIDRVEEIVVKALEKDEEEGERMGERELLGEVKAACMEVRGRLGLAV